MLDYHPALGYLRRDPPQAARDVLIGEAVKSVAAYPLSMQPLGDGKSVRDLRVAPVEGGIEAGNLQHLAAALQYHAYRCEVVRLMQRRQGREARKLAEHGFIDDGRLGIGGTAVHHAMADRNR